MKRFTSALLCLLLLVCVLLPARAAENVPKAVMEAAQSVVRILSEGNDSSSTGSGFVIQNIPGEVLIVTNNHVVDNSPYSISVWVGDDELVDAQIVFTTPEKDLCVLRVEEKLSLKALVLSGEEPLQGAAVYAVGYPGVADIFSDTDAHTSDAATITDGIISAVRSLTLEDYAEPVKLLQTNAAINAGNSGGPLFNTKGEVIGINTYGISNSQGVFGAIDVSELKALLAENNIKLAPVEQERASGVETVQQEVLLKERSFTPLRVILIVLAAISAVGALLLIVVRKKKKAMTLREFLEANPGGLGVSKAVSLLMGIAVQLRDQHSNGAPHLEVSPDNILVTPNGVKLTEHSGREENRFSAGFAAPEIYRGEGVGIASDIYSFAAVLLHAVTGCAPENSLHREQVEEQLALLEQTEPEAAGILRDCMALSPQERVSSMQELIFRISAFNTQAYRIPEETWKDTSGAGRSRWKLAAIPAAAALLLLLAAILVPGMLRRSQDYANALTLLEAGQYDRAEDAFARLGNYKDCPEKILETQYRRAAALLEAEQYDSAIAAFEALGDYEDSRERVVYAENARDYASALALLEAEEYEQAYTVFAQLGDFRDAGEYLNRFRIENVKLAQRYGKDGVEGYTLTYEYKNGVLWKETCTFTADANSSFYGHKMDPADIPLGESTASYTAVYSVSAEGRRKKVNVFNSNKNLIETRVYEYDENGNLVKESRDSKTSDSNDATFTYKYDENGNMIQKLWYDNLSWSGTPYYRYTWEYDSHNEIIRYYYKYSYSYYYYYYRTFTDEDTYIFENQYDGEGRILRHAGVEGASYAYEYEYDDAGNLIHKVNIYYKDTNKNPDGEVTWEETYAYDELGNMIRKTYKSLSSDYETVTEYTFGDIYIFA